MRYNPWRVRACWAFILTLPLACVLPFLPGWSNNVTAISLAAIASTGAFFLIYRANKVAISRTNDVLVIQNVFRRYELATSEVTGLINQTPWWFVLLRIGFMDMTAVFKSGKTRPIIALVTLGKAPVDPVLKDIVGDLLPTPEDTKSDKTLKRSWQ